jgi:hypothetical protein
MIECSCNEEFVAFLKERNERDHVALVNNERLLVRWQSATLPSKTLCIEVRRAGGQRAIEYRIQALHARIEERKVLMTHVRFSPEKAS